MPSKLPIAEYFKYHPPQTETRIRNHELINNIAQTFAEAVDTLVVDEECKRMAFFAIQQARMSANQGLTVDELHSLQGKGLAKELGT